MSRDIDTQSKIDLSNDIDISRRQIADGKGIPNDVVFKRIHDMLMRMKAEEDAAALRADVAAAEAELDADLGIPHDELKKQIAAETEETFRSLGI